ncbi:MAG: hypothetical protein JWO82_190, partial [Akkermansiaceae bacterium]|nr:hypothetical protein [Akkermansiaceae bacterium]
MDSLTDRMLLDRFLATREEAAFACLVRRYLDQVHAVARRVTANDELARDVAQATFIRLAQGAARIPHELPLSSWLHRISRGLAVDAVRSEDRRRKRELRAGSDSPTLTSSPPIGTHASEPDWSALAPVVDELVERLPAADRDVLLLRYYRNESHATIAARLGLTESTARMRASRALEKLRVLLGKKGLATSSAALATLLPAHAAPVVPGLVAASVLQAAHGIVPLAPSLLNPLFLTVTSAQKIALAGALLLMLAATGYTLSPDPTMTAVASLTAQSPPPLEKLEATRARTPRPVPATAQERLERLKAILAGQNLNRRRAELIAYLDALPSGLWEETCGVLLEMEGTPRDEALTYALYGWAKANPLAALAFAQAEATRNPLGRDLKEDVITGWAAVDFPAARDWVATQAPGRDRCNLSNTVLTAGLLNSPEEVMKVAGELTDPAERKRVMFMLAFTVARQEDLQARMMAACTPEQQAEVIDWVGNQGDPRRAITLMREHPEAEEHVDFRSLYGRLGMFQFDQAKAALAAMEPGPRRREAATGMLDAATGKSPEMAREIMQLYPDAVNDQH